MGRIRLNHVRKSYNRCAGAQTGRTVLLATLFLRDAFCAVDVGAIQEAIRLGLLTSVRHAPSCSGLTHSQRKTHCATKEGFPLPRGPPVPKSVLG